MPETTEGPGTVAVDGGGGGAVPPPTRRSVWTRKEKLVRVLWGLCRPVWVLVPGARPALLRAFGGQAGPGCRFAGSVQVTIPWNVRCGARVVVGEGVNLYALGPITIGDDTVIDRRAHLCAGTHDMTDSRFPLIKPPIVIGKRCLLGIDSYVGPYVEMGDDCRVAPRASVFKSVGAGSVLRGNPAKVEG